jgi:hypothetical protein
MTNKEIVYWKMKNGVSISIDDMDINHLRNILKMIVKNSNKHKVQKEAKQFNLNGDMANDFNDTYPSDECGATEIDIY